jgi:hypothetical protein
MWLAADEDRVPVSSGRSFRVDSPPENGLVTPKLSNELKKVLERFASDAGFDEQNRVGIVFRPGIFGHHKVGRAADIYGVGGLRLDIWKKRWDKALQCTRHTGNSSVLDVERRKNLGWRLYKALQNYGRWSQPYGYPIQLFGPWTRSEGPWKYISDFLLHAHRDHIHVAK